MELTSINVMGLLSKMNPSLAELQKQALRLTAEERERLGETLIASSHEKELNEVDRKWIAVAEERFEYLISGKDTGISEMEFFAKIEERLGWK